MNAGYRVEYAGLQPLSPNEDTLHRDELGSMGLVDR